MGDEETVGTPPEETTTEEETEDYKALYETELKASSGKDQKVSQLLNEVKKYREVEQKRSKERERLERQNMNTEQLQAYIDRKIDEIETNAQREIEKKEVQFREYKRKNRLLDAVSQVDNAPPELLKIVTMDWPDDEDKLRDTIQEISDKWNDRLERHKIIIDNKRRTSSAPKSGDKGTYRLPTGKAWEKMDQEEQLKAVENASLDELKNSIKEGMEK